MLYFLIANNHPHVAKYLKSHRRSSFLRFDYFNYQWLDWWHEVDKWRLFPATVFFDDAYQLLSLSNSKRVCPRSFEFAKITAADNSRLINSKRRSAYRFAQNNNRNAQLATTLNQ